MEILSFDAAVELDSKAEELEVKKIEKRDQLERRATDLKVEIAKAKQKFKKSIINPDQDSVGMLMDIEVMEKELEYTKKVLLAIFPDAA